MSSKLVANELVGAVWPAAQPGEDPVLYGHARLEPQGTFEARSLQSFKMVYTVGRYGIDDTGSIRIVFRFMGDAGDLQTSDPRGYNYVSAHTNNSSRVSLQYAKTGHTRPFFKALTVRLHGGYLREGDTIVLDVEKRELNVELTDDEIAERMRGWTPPPPNYTTGVLAKYAALVSSASEGAITRPDL